ncbi:MAG: hypothetical protein M3Y25_05465 [Thermoproteota archaeon]|nr:hypothetical protein [Thermoproteota archaeon]
MGWNVDNQEQSSSIEEGQNRNNAADNNTIQEGVYFVKSTDNGASFDEVLRINSEEEPGEIQIDASNDNVYVLWGAPDPSTTEREYEGGNQSEDKRHDPGSGDSNVDTRGDSEGDGVYFVKSADNGDSFTQPLFIKEQFQNPLNVEIIEHMGKLFMTIQATPMESTLGENQDIYFMSSPDGGDTFTSAFNISNNPGVSECPSLTVVPGSVDGNSSSRLFVVWQDNSPGNNEALSTSIAIPN